MQLTSISRTRIGRKYLLDYDAKSIEMPLIFKPGHKYLLRQTYTVAVVGAAALSSLTYAGGKLAARFYIAFHIL